MPARNTSVMLGESLSDFAHQQVEKGNYGSTSEVVRAGVRLLAENEARHEALLAALQEGEDSGPPEPFDFDEFLAEMKAKHGIE